MIKKFNEATNEASLQGNIGIPGEGGRGGKKYLTQAEQKARQKNMEFQTRYGREIPNFMGLVARAREIQRGKEKQLEKLAEQAIRAFYDSILDGVSLNIKFPKEGEIKDMMEDVPEEPQEMPSLKKLEDEDIIDKIQMRKIANNITQGEAKNAKKCLELDIVKDGLIEILGKSQGEEYHKLIGKITDIASFFDWQIPVEVQKEMWSRDKNGFSGSVKVEWDTPEEKEGESPEELAQKILRDLEEGNELPKEETEELFDQTVPTINALGTDFAMLLHETIKGIYELIAANALPDEGSEEEAETIILNTDSLADEIEDLRYGPEIAGDLREFLNTFKESDLIVNFREKVFGKMMGMQPKEFLDLMFLILNGDPSAKNKIQPLVNEVKSEEEEYTKRLKDYEMGLAGIEPEEEPEEIKKIKAYVGVDQPEEETDYSKLSQMEIQRMIDRALDSGDYDKARELSPYLKESKRVELHEKIHMYEGYPSNKKHKDNY